MKLQNIKTDLYRNTHLIIVVMITVLMFVVTVEVLCSGWGLWSILIMLLCVAAAWWCHILKKPAVKQRTYIYAMMIVTAMFYYGANSKRIYETSVIALIAILLFTMTDEKPTVSMCGGTFIVVLIYRLSCDYFDGVLLARVNPLAYMFHAGAVIVAWRISFFMINIHVEETDATSGLIDELEEMNRHTEDFMANVSHELRTPINAVTGITSVMLRNESDERKRRDIVSVQAAGNRLMRQIGDILDYTEIDTGRLSLSEEDYIITSVINDIVMGVKEIYPDTGLEIIVNADTRIPMKLHGDPRRIKKMLYHLIDNAVKFTQTGGVYVKVRAIEKPYGVNLCIEVRDTGIGISDDEKIKITERFYQSDSGRNRKTGGLGLGLAIVNGFVNAMKGFMRIDSTVGKGTCVRVSFPQKVVDKNPCMSVKDASSICAACYLRPEKYSIPEIREFYDEMINDLVHSLGVQFHRAYGKRELDRLRSAYNLTHIFIAKEEYLASPDYFEKIDRSTRVVVVNDGELRLGVASRMTPISKPFYALPVVNILNSGREYVVGDSPLDARKPLFPGVRVLAVDDEAMNLIVAKGIFSGYKMQTDTAPSGAAALDMCKNRFYDIIFLDHMMPEMDGIETLKNLKKIYSGNEKHPIYISLTANAVSGAREMFLAEGFDEFITKPIETIEFERTLKKLLPESMIQYEEVPNTSIPDSFTEIIYDSADSDTGYSVRETEPEQPDTAQPIEVQQESVQPEPAQPAPAEDEPVTDYIAFLGSKGINTADALGYCMNSDDLYKELIESFCTGYAEKAAEISSFFAAEDWANYRIKVHALKSTSKMIGADELSALALAAETASKENNADYIKAHNGELEEKYRVTALIFGKSIGTAVAGAETAPAQEAVQDASASQNTAEDVSAAAEQVPDKGEIQPGELAEQLGSAADMLRLGETGEAVCIIGRLYGYTFGGVSMDDTLRRAAGLAESGDGSSAELVIAGLIGEAVRGAVK
ncbi:MAG: response regulator [Ruminiclostridium sp.]|nr:response regulator [Ruminiclostridium sp.]